jgi:hypothetical protein
MISVSFDAIVPAPFNAGIIRLYILNEARKIMTDIKKDFDRTVKTWTTKPKFEKNVGFGTSRLSIEVGTDDANYRRVSDGTVGKPRIARGAGLAVDGKPRALTILPYAAKTIPGQIDAGAGGYAEGPIIFRKYALNAGKIRPRKFEDLIFEKWEDEMAERFQAALDAAAIRTGYAI